MSDKLLNCKPCKSCRVFMSELESRNALLEKRCDSLTQELEQLKKLDSDDLKELEKYKLFRSYRGRCLALEKENALLRRVKEAAETVAFNVAGTVGTKTNSELPEWFRLRMSDLVKALSASERGEK